MFLVDSVFVRSTNLSSTVTNMLERAATCSPLFGGHASFLAEVMVRSEKLLPECRSGYGNGCEAKGNGC
jgi:hypothetical protein